MPSLIFGKRNSGCKINHRLQKREETGEFRKLPGPDRGGARRGVLAQQGRTEEARLEMTEDGGAGWGTGAVHRPDRVGGCANLTAVRE